MKYPVLLVHGMGFRDSNIINYWGRIPKALEQLGCKIFYGNQDGNGAIESNGQFLKQRIEEIMSENEFEKINIIAHSKGGLDARYAMSTLGMGKYVASLTTISTPHNGSVTVDKLLQFPDFLVKTVGKCTDLVLRLRGDKNPDSYKVFHELSTEQAKSFNESNPNYTDTYYQSYAFVMENPLSDIFLCFTNFVVGLIEGQNDGFLTPDSVKWGEFKGIVQSNSRRGISHCDEVDMRRRCLTKKQGSNVSDIIDLYKNIATELAEKGF